MKFLSIANIYESALQSIKRFYLPMLFAFAGSIGSIALVESTSKDNELIIRLIYTCVLAMNFSFGATLYAERRSSKTLTILLPIVSAILAFLYGYFASPHLIFDDFRSTLLFFVLFIVVHLWVAVAAYINIDEKRAFWHFNEALFLRIITGAIFSLVLYGGLALAIFALDSLFNYATNDRMYADLFIVVAGVFNTWFFLSGIPRNYDTLNHVNTFPKGLKIFVQYILIPLAIIYLLILYAYSIKILVMFNLPKGWVSMLILWYAVFGILAMLLAYPLRDDKDNPWVRLYSRFFFIGLLPLIVLLFLAVWVRIQDYGITELRYYVLLLGIWLMFVTIYFIFSRQKNIKIIPVTLIMAGVLSLFGPWSVFSTSQASQIARFENLLLKNKLWEQEKGFINADSIDKVETEQIESIIDFFVTRSTEAKLQPFFTVNLDSLRAGVLKKLADDDQYYKVSLSYNSWALKDKIKDSMYSLMHIDIATNTALYASVPDYITGCNLESNKFIDVSGYKAVWEYYYDQSANKVAKTAYVSATDSLMIKMENSNADAQLKFYKSGNSDSISFRPLIAYIEKAKPEGNSLSVEQMTLVSNTGKYKIVVKSFHFNGRNQNDDGCIGDVEALLLIK